MVTIPTVRISISFAMRAMTGAAPVPVPPPIPAVMNTILVPSFNCSLISSILSSAASRARSGRLPAPSPCVMLRPSCSFTGTGDSANAWLSVLQRTNVTSCMPSRYMWFTALPPPPPTPITLMILGESVGKSNCTISSILLNFEFISYRRQRRFPLSGSRSCVESSWDRLLSSVFLSLLFPSACGVFRLPWQLPGLLFPPRLF